MIMLVAIMTNMIITWRGEVGIRADLRKGLRFDPKDPSLSTREVSLKDGHEPPELRTREPRARIRHDF